MNASPPTPRDWELERLLLGELSPARTRALESQLAQDPALQQRLAQLKQGAEGLMQRLPPTPFAQEVYRRLDAQKRVEAASRAMGSSEETQAVPTSALRSSRRSIGLMAALSTTVTAALAGVILLHTDGLDPGGASSDGLEQGSGLAALTNPIEQSSGSADITRSKGLEPQLRIYRLEGERITRLFDAAPVPAHARLQLSYLTPGQPYGVLLSIDGAGTVTLHQPTTPGGEPRLDPSGEHQLPFSYELDEAPDFERFFLVSAEKPVAVQTVVAAAETLARDPKQAKVSPLALPGDVHQTSLLLEKVNP